MNKVAIVIGATGLVGTEVVIRLLKTEQIDKIISITRRPVNYGSAKVENHVIEFSRLNEYSDLFRGDYLFSCLGTTKALAKSFEAQRTVDLDYQFQAAQLALENGVEHYLLVSSNAANAKSFHPYLKMKGELEEKIALLEFRKTSVFQPSLLLGERKDMRVAEGVGAKILPILCRLPGLAKFKPISGREVAEKMVCVSQRSDLGYQCYRLDEVFP